MRRAGDIVRYRDGDRMQPVASWPKGRGMRCIGCSATNRMSYRTLPDRDLPTGAWSLLLCFDCADVFDCGDDVTRGHLLAQIRRRIKDGCHEAETG